MSFGKSQSQPSQTTQTQKTEPWEGQQPYLRDLLARAQSQMNQGGGEFYPGQLVAPQSQQTVQAQKMLTSAAGGMQPTIDAASSQAIWNLTGAQDIGNHPYLQNAINAAAQPVVQNFNSVGGPLAQIRGSFTANNSGGTGTREGIAAGVAQRGLGQILANMSSTMTMDAYRQAQDNAMKTLALAPQTAAMATMPAELMQAVGGQNDAYAQSLINAEVARHNYNAQLPWLNLQNYGNLVTGNMGSTSTGTTTAPSSSTNPLLAGLGGAATGASIAGIMGKGATFGPWGAGIGALLGLLGSR